MRTLLIVVAFSIACFALGFAQSSAWDRIPDEIRERNAFKRFEWFYRQRAFPYDTIPLAYFLAERTREHARQVVPSQQLVTWNPIGPVGLNSTWPPAWGEMSGRVRGLAVHPTDPNVVYIGAAAGGLWKTTNGGTSWAFLSEDFAANTFGAIAIDPVNPDIVYAGTGEAMSSFNVQNLDGQGLFKSTNAGATWTQITHGFGARTHFSMIAVDPFTPNVVLACLASGYSFIGNLTNEGVWRSTNGGLNWTRVVNIDNAFDVVFHPSSNGVVYAAAGNNGGVYRSTNHGETWVQVNSGLPATIVRIQIAIANSSPSVLYAMIYGSGTTRVYKTTNDGGTWFQISSGVQLGGTYNGSTWVDQAWYDATIAVKPDNPDVAVLGNVEIHRTVNGSTFAPVRLTTGPYGGTRAWDCPTHTDIHRIVFSPSHPGVAYLASDGGVYKSTDGGGTWTSVNRNISTIQFYRLASHPTNRNIIIGGAQDNGNFRTTNGGTTPWHITTTGDGMECFFDHTDPNYVFASTQNGALFRSTAGGAYGTFSSIAPSWDVTPNWTTPFIIHPTNNNILYTASRRVWRSTNRGTSWTQITGAIATSDVINCLAISPTRPEFMALSASGYSNANPQVMVSSDGGFNWTDVTSRIGGVARYVARVVFHPLDHSTLFVVRSGFGSGKLYISNTFGTDWRNVSGDLPDIPASDFFVDPRRPHHWYLANDFGVYLSTNNGVNWIRQAAGVPITPGLDFDYFSSGGTRLLRLGTHGRSAYEAELALESTASIFVTPVEVLFKRLEVNGAGDTVTATIYNVGTQNLQVSAITKNSSAFTLLDVPALPATIAANSSLQLRIVFRPTAHGIVTDSLRIVSNDPSSATTYVPLRGSGVQITSARPGVLYATGNGNLYSVNTSTGAATVIGGLGVVSLDALAINPVTRELYGISVSGTGTDLYRVSSQFGEALPAGRISLGNVRGIVLQSDGSAYATTSGGNLYRVTLSTGDTLRIGSSGLAYAGLAQNPLTAELWASVRPAITNRDHLYKVNPATGAATFVGATGDNAVTPSIAFSPTGALYGLKGVATQTNTLIAIDTTTGSGSTIGSTGVSGLVSIALRTDSLVTNVVSGPLQVPAAYRLHQNYPNPFNPSTTIRYDLPETGFVTMKLFDMLGREVVTLVNEVQGAGYRSVVVNAKELASGMYVYTMKAGRFLASKKLLLVR